MPKSWTKTVDHMGVSIRLFERGGTIYRDVTLGRTTSATGKARTAHDIKSLGHADRKLAEKQAKQLAEAIAEARLTGRPAGDLTLGQLRTQYLERRGALLTPVRLGKVKSAFALIVQHFGTDFRLANLDQHRVDTYVAARGQGRVRSADYRSHGRVQAGTIRSELQTLAAACNWASTYLVNGHPLLPRNPMRGVTLPQEENPKRPRATAERYQKIAAAADGVDPSGQLRLMVELAWRTGRRINAILHLTAADVLLTREALLAALADAGQGTEIAAQWPGGLRWRAEWDKKGYETFSPLPSALHSTLSAYVRDKGIIGEGWLFAGKGGAPVNVSRASYRLGKAEAAARLPTQARGGWHAFRRGWATLRKSFPVQDVMAAGGWRDPAALQTAYQGADSATIMGVVDLEESA